MKLAFRSLIAISLFLSLVSNSALSASSCGKLELKSAATCENLSGEFDLSDCGEAPGRYPADIECRGDSTAVATAKTKRATYRTHLKVLKDDWGSMSWRPTGKIRRTSYNVPEKKMTSQPERTEKPDEKPIPKRSKDGYTLFHPTPRGEMREFSPDRPGSLNTPYTIDAGHYELEVELSNYSHLTLNDVTTNTLNFPNPNLRVGLTNSSEIQIATVPQIRQTITTPDGSQTTSGIGDTNLRFKFNVLGNDGGPIAWAIMPAVKIPTNTNGLGNSRMEPSLMIPFNFNLPGDWDFGVMPELDVRKNAGDTMSHTEFVAPFGVGHNLIGVLDGFAEFVSHSSNEDGAVWLNYIGTGLSAKVSSDMQFDVSCNFGLNAVTPQYAVITGWVVRY